MAAHKWMVTDSPLVFRCVLCHGTKTIDKYGMGRGNIDPLFCAETVFTEEAWNKLNKWEDEDDRAVRD